ncbi:MAG: hypothetical protein LC642_08370, partial [Verrucomicrobiaceae bacterium]|nr:hypothetical protein [Verrucomicrobiaceae bacterium]
SNTDRDFSGDGSRDAQGEAIAPFLQNSSHVDTLTIRRKMLVWQDSPSVDVRRVALSERRRGIRARHRELLQVVMNRESRKRGKKTSSIPFWLHGFQNPVPAFLFS